jgi:glycine/serine hydroxymethyltransferase
VGRWIADALLQRSDATALTRIRKEVLNLCEAYPLYAERRAKAQAEVRA